MKNHPDIPHITYEKAAILLLLSATAIYSCAQKKDDWKNLKETEPIVKFLASDEPIKPIT